MTDQAVAAIDCGARRTRLLVRQGGGIVERRSVLTGLARLGVGWGRMSLVGIERTLDAVSEFKTVIDDLGIERVRVIATPVAHRAASSADLPPPPEPIYYGSREELFEGVAALVGFAPEPLTTEQTGRLAFTGASSELDGDVRALVVALGEWSTAFAVGAGTCEATAELNEGSLTLTEAFLRGDPPRAEEIAAARAHAEREVGEVAGAVVGDDRNVRLVAVGDVAAAVAALTGGTPTASRDHIHHLELSVDDVESALAVFGKETFEERIEHVGIGLQGADVIVGGCCMLVSAMRALGLDTCTVSHAGVLDGVAVELASGA